MYSKCTKRKKTVRARARQPLPWGEGLCCRARAPAFSVLDAGFGLFRHCVAWHEEAVQPVAGHVYVWPVSELEPLWPYGSLYPWLPELWS